MPIDPTNNSSCRWNHVERNDKTRVEKQCKFLFPVKHNKPKILNAKPSPEFIRIKLMISTKVPDVSKEFVAGVIQIAKDLNCKAEDLTTLIYIESHFDPSQKNGSFHGLVQMNENALNSAKEYAKDNPKMCKGVDLNKSFESFCKQSREEQLPYVKAYLLKMKEMYVKSPAKKLSGGELYTLVLAPSNFNEKYVIAKDSSNYKGNSNLDVNKRDGGITKKDLQDFMDMKRMNELSLKPPLKI